MRVALDTNVLACAEGINDAARRDRVLDLLGRIPQDAIVIPVQVLGELFNVLTRKAGRSREAARDALLGWQDSFALAATTPEVMSAAAGLAADHRIGIWDATILAAGARAGCRLLLSEDLSDGFTWNGMTVADPFAPTPHPVLRDIGRG